MSLADFQDRFTERWASHSVKPSDQTLPQVQRSATFNKRMDIYRELALSNLHGHMTRIFPICQRLLPAIEFRAACDAYFREVQPKSINAMQYAQEFPSFLENFTTEQDLPQLADIATLDFGCYQSKQAIDASSVNSQIFTGLSPEQLANRKVQLHPACFWMASSFAIFDVWYRYNAALPVKSGNILLPQEVLIIRPQLTVEVHRIDPGFVKALDAIDEGKSLNQALLQGSVADPEFNAVAAIQFLIQNNLIVSLY